MRGSSVEMRQQARNQRHALLHWPVVVDGVRQHLDELLHDLSERITVLEQESARVVQAGEWAASATLLQSITGLGTLTAAWLLVSTLNFTLCESAEAATAYAGLAP